MAKAEVEAEAEENDKVTECSSLLQHSMHRHHDVKHTHRLCGLIFRLQSHQHQIKTMGLGWGKDVYDHN